MPEISRRDLLKIAVGTAAAASGIYGLGRLLETVFSPEKKTKILGGKKEIEVSLGSAENINFSGIEFYPDGHSSFIKDESGIKVWLAGDRWGYLLKGQDLKHLNPQAKEVIGPGKTGFDRDYAAPGSVITGKNPGELLMFYHGEYRPRAPEGFPFNAGVGLAVSVDGGLSWEKKGQIIKGQEDKPAMDKVFGAGQPSAIIKDNFIYLYFVDWNSQYPDSIHLARSPFDSDHGPDSWEKFYDGSFVKEGMAGKSSPVILPSKGAVYTSLPSVSWNSYLNQYLAAFESMDGFYLALSADGIDWKEPSKFLGVQTANNNPREGQIWNSYPTLWSSNKPNDRETDENMLLVYSEGRWNQGTHSMKIRQLNFKAAVG